MTVRFKSQTEYQKSFGVSRSRSASPQRCMPLAGLRSDQMGVSREPGLQRLRRPLGPVQSSTSLLHPPGDEQQHSLAHRAAPSAGFRSHSAHRRLPSPEPNPPTPPRGNPGSPTDPETPAGPRPAEEPAADGKPVKPRPLQPDSQPQPSQSVTAAANGQPVPSGAEIDYALRQKAGLRSGGQRLGGKHSEYHRQFGWKKPTAAAASPLLTAEQVLHSSSRSVPPFKINPVSMETEYRCSFQGLAPPAGPRLRKHLEHQRVPLFQTYKTTRRRKEESQKKPRLQRDALQRDMPPPPRQVRRGYRMLTEYESSFRSPLCRIPEGGGAMDSTAQQVKELRQKALLYRHRAWGTNFSRDHLSQLVSEHNALWEPTDTTVSANDPASPRLPPNPSPDRDSHSTSCVEPLDLASHSSKRSSIAGSETQQMSKDTRIKKQAVPGPPAERRTAWGEEEEQKQEEEETTDEEEGRLPTPEIKMKPVQRTHHDLTTPAAGGAILVGKLRSTDGSSPLKHQRCGSAVSMAAGSETPAKRKEAWSDNIAVSYSPAHDHKSASSPPFKPTRMKQTLSPAAAPLPLVPAPLHGFQGTLRHPDFQHNGELGLRFRERPCPGGGCCSDEDDRLSVMSWRSAVSCSTASAVLERAQKRREDFWGKR
ncbi:homeobox protein SIX4 [Sarotherodon galilaeus]